MKRALVGLLFLFAAGIASSASGREIVVDPEGRGDFTEIQPAIDAAMDGDTVSVEPGEYAIVEPISFKGKLITVAGSGAGRTTIRMSESPAEPARASVVVFESREGPGAILSGFTLTGGRGTAPISGSGSGFPRGGGVLCGSSPTIANCTITGNFAGDSGGGLSVGRGASPTLTSCTIAGNLAGKRGGGVYCRDGAAPTFTNCTISGNAAQEDGGGVFCDVQSSPTLTSCTVAGNSAGRGGGVYCKGAGQRAPSATLTGCILWDNVGGSIFSEACPGSPLASCELSPAITYSSIEGDTVWPGAGNINADPLFCGWGETEEVYVDAASPGPGDGSSENPYADLASAVRYSYALSARSPCLDAGEDRTNMGAGHGVCDSEGAATRLVHVAPGSYTAQVLAHHASLRGAGADETMLRGTLHGLRTGASVSDVTVTGGFWTGISVVGGEAPDIRRSTISGNRGDGILCESGASPRLTDCRIIGNSGSGVLLRESSGTPAMTGCTISGNGGPGVWCWSASPLLTNCLITANAHGGVRCSGGSAVPDLRQCTISGNTGIVGGSGVWCGSASPIITGCIIWNNPLGSFGFSPGATPTVSYSCLDEAELPAGEGNINVDPRFVREGIFLHPERELPAIADPGDYHLQTGSPCIDTATSTGAPTTDIEGSARPCGEGVDMGAYESGACPPPTPFVRGDADADGNRNVSDAVFILEHLFARGDRPPCEKSADVNDSGKVDLTDPVVLLAALFAGGPPPAPPLSACGPDPTVDDLTCGSFEGCP